jgi:hypothetical protein
VQAFVGFVDAHGVTKPVPGIGMTLYTPAGTKFALSGVSDGKGLVTFHVPYLEFKVGAAYLDQTFWSPNFTWQNTL